MTVLSIRGLGKAYGGNPALVDFDLDVAAGSRTAVVGPSGSGKTTLLRLIAGFETPDAGEIRLDGGAIASASQCLPAHRRNIGLVMQEGALFPHLSVIENIRFGIRNRVDGESRALMLMDLVELSRSMADRQPHQLSGGQQQRVALARALARQPQVMLLDEPYSALDADLRHQLRQSTAAILAASRITSILVTHDREEAMTFSETLVVLHQGRLLQVGRPQDIYLRPVDPNVASFLGPAVFLEGFVHGDVAETPIGALPIDPPHSSADGAAVVLVRPEQFRLSRLTSGYQGEWVLRDAIYAGSSARITIERPRERFSLTFETSAVELPNCGEFVQLTVVGTVRAFRAPGVLPSDAATDTGAAIGRL